MANYFVMNHLQMARYQRIFSGEWEQWGSDSRTALLSNYAGLRQNLIFLKQSGKAATLFARQLILGVRAALADPPEGFVMGAERLFQTSPTTLLSGGYMTRVEPPISNEERKQLWSSGASAYYMEDVQRPADGYDRIFLTEAAAHVFVFGSVDRGGRGGPKDAMHMALSKKMAEILG